MGSDWFAGSVCCDSLNHLQKRPAPQLSNMCSGCIVNNVVNIAYHFEPDCDPENISEEDRAEPVQARLLIIIIFFSEWYVVVLFLFVCSCLILLDTLLFVNATAYVSF